MNYNDLKVRVANLKNQVATQKARTEQARLLVEERERNIQTTFGVPPDQLAAELAKTEAEIQATGTQILSILQTAGA